MAHFCEHMISKVEYHFLADVFSFQTQFVEQCLFREVLHVQMHRRHGSARSVAGVGILLVCLVRRTYGGAASKAAAQIQQSKRLASIVRTEIDRMTLGHFCVEPLADAGCIQGSEPYPEEEDFESVSVSSQTLLQLQ